MDGNTSPLSPSLVGWIHLRLDMQFPWEVGGDGAAEAGREEVIEG